MTDTGVPHLGRPRCDTARRCGSPCGRCPAGRRPCPPGGRRSQTGPSPARAARSLCPPPLTPPAGPAACSAHWPWQSKQHGTAQCITVQRSRCLHAGTGVRALRVTARPCHAPETWRRAPGRCQASWCVSPAASEQAGCRPPTAAHSACRWTRHAPEVVAQLGVDVGRAQQGPVVDAPRVGPLLGAPASPPPGRPHVQAGDQVPLSHRKPAGRGAARQRAWGHLRAAAWHPDLGAWGSWTACAAPCKHATAVQVKGLPCWGSKLATSGQCAFPRQSDPQQLCRIPPQQGCALGPLLVQGRLLAALGHPHAAYAEQRRNGRHLLSAAGARCGQQRRAQHGRQRQLCQLHAPRLRQPAQRSPHLICTGHARGSTGLTSPTVLSARLACDRPPCRAHPPTAPGTCWP